MLKCRETVIIYKFRGVRIWKFGNLGNNKRVALRRSSGLDHHRARALSSEYREPLRFALQIGRKAIMFACQEEDSAGSE